MVREMLGIPKARMQEALASLHNYVPKGVILATCNRTEVYALDDENHSAERAIRQFLQDWAGLYEDELAPHLYIHHDYRAMRRLCKITSGLYSMIIREHEILGQVGQSLEEAEKADLVNEPLRRLFQHAIGTGRKVRNETGISRNALSVSSVAVDLAAKVTGDISESKALLVGAGEAGKLVAKAFVQRGVSRIAVASRSLQRAQDLASDLGGVAVDISEMVSQMEDADMVISCTGAPHVVIHRDAVAQIMASRPQRALVIVDIAVPRDVEFSVKQIPNVFLYDIDDLNKVSGTNKEDREREVEKSLDIITSELEYLLEWWQTLEAKPTIGRLMQMAEDVRQRQMNATFKKLPPMTQEQQDSLDAMTKSIVKKILHNPIQYLRENGHENEEVVMMLRDLFALDERRKK
jgi:glutamyl-tRNA reductase